MDKKKSIRDITTIIKHELKKFSGICDACSRSYSWCDSCGAESLSSSASSSRRGGAVGAGARRGGGGKNAAFSSVLFSSSHSHRHRQHQHRMGRRGGENRGSIGRGFRGKMTTMASLSSSRHQQCNKTRTVSHKSTSSRRPKSTYSSESSGEGKTGTTI